MQECNHGRSNETRDRLRKRLHQIHSKSSTKAQHTKSIKNQPGVLKRMLAAKVPTSQLSVATSSAVPLADSSATKTNIEQKDNSTNESIVEKKLDALEIVKEMAAAGQVVSKNVRQSTATLTVTTTTTIKAGTATSTATVTQTNNGNTTSVSKRKLYHAIDKHINECTYNMCKDCDEMPAKKAPTAAPATASTTASVAGVTVKPQQRPSFTTPVSESLYVPASVRHASFCPTSPSEMASLNDILQFIEGNATSTSKKDLQKKAAKKAKQKQKKEDVKKVEELEQLRDEFHEVYFKEFDAKNELKTLKNAKKRDKKKVADLEGHLKKYGKIKSKLEASILELIFTLKANSSDFKFSYLPTKEQQQQQQLQKQQTEPAARMSTPTPTPTQPTRANPTVPIVDVKQQPSILPLKNQAHAVIADIQEQQGSNSGDPSKRMVTIRRVNMPNAEPQVTITAKGASPDTDKLMYTFLNGEFVRGEFCHAIF